MKDFLTSILKILLCCAIISLGFRITKIENRVDILENQIVIEEVKDE